MSKQVEPDRRARATASLPGVGARLVLAGGMAALASLFGFAAASADSGKTYEAEVAGSWYRPNPTCTTPVGCVDVSLPSPYPAGTVHAGVLGGIEESRAFVGIDVPKGAELVEGTLTLPVASAADGSVAPETAKLRACLATGTFRAEDQGVSTMSPTPLCVFSSPVEVVVAEDPLAVDQLKMTVDLTPFLATWTTEDVGILAILPEEGLSPTDAWHVAFSTSEREDETAKPMSASFVAVKQQSAEPSDEPTTGPNDEEASAPDPGLPPIGSSLPGSQPVPLTGEAPELGSLDTGVVPAAVDQMAQPPVADLTLVGALGYPYPGAYLVPLIFALAVVWSARAFTVDLAKERR